MTIINNYYQSKIGNTEDIVTLKPVNELDSVLDVKKFMSNYKFSRFGFNLFIIKRLVKKILIEKLQTEMVWNNDIWNHSKVILLNCEFIINNHEYFQQIKKAINENKFTEKKQPITKNRLKDIVNLTNKIKSNIKLDHPLFISGTILNKLGGNSDNNEIFIIDGSRRILAESLLKNNIKIWLIIQNTEIN